MSESIWKIYPDTGYGEDSSHRVLRNGESVGRVMYMPGEDKFWAYSPWSESRRHGTYIGSFDSLISAIDSIKEIVQMSYYRE